MSNTAAPTTQPPDTSDIPEAPEAPEAAITQTPQALADDLDARIAAAVAKAVEPLAQKLATADADRDRAIQRERYIAGKMKDVPAVYLAQLGDDPEKFAEQEQVIRKQFRADLAAAGIKAPNLGYSGGGGMSVLALCDHNAATASENISAGLAAVRHQRPQALPVAEAMKETHTGG